MPSDRIDTSLLTPVLPRTVITPARDNFVRPGQGEEVRISREARALQALDTGANAELLVNKQEQGAELRSYLETVRNSEAEAGSGQILEGQYQKKALEDPFSRVRGQVEAASSVSAASPENRAAIQAYQAAGAPDAPSRSASIDLLA